MAMNCPSLKSKKQGRQLQVPNTLLQAEGIPGIW